MRTLPVDSRLPLATAVTRSGRAMLLNADNTAGEWVTVRAAVESGRAFFVVPDRRLLAVDLDLPEDRREAGRREAAFKRLVSAAEQARVPMVVCSSGRPGNRHAFLVVETEVDKATLRDWCRVRGLDVRTRGIRPPGTPHRSGRYVSSLTSPKSAVEAAAVLAYRPGPEPSRALTRMLSPVRLPAKARSALQHGHGAAGYESASHARMGLAVAIRAQGGPISLLSTLLSDTTSPLGETFRRRAGAWQRAELHRLWEKAGAWLGTRPARPPVERDIDQWAQAVYGSAWRGMAGGTDLAVAEVFLRVARKAGTVRTGVATGDIACGAGVSTDTARRSVRRLLDAGWLRVHEPETYTTSRVYRLCVPTGAPLGAVPAATDDDDLGQDAARWRALGKLTARVLRLIRNGRTVAELATALHWSHGAVRRHLRKLRAFRAARCDGSRWFSLDGATEFVVATSGVDGAGVRQRATLAWRRESRRRHATSQHAPPTVGRAMLPLPIA